MTMLYVFTKLAFFSLISSYYLGEMEILYKFVIMVAKEVIVRACRSCWEQSGRGKLLIGLSGGADSTALFLAAMKANIPFEAAHCNFNLRGEESLRDRDFVKQLCEKHQIPLNLKEFDVKKEALKGESTEMTCRRIRYDFFKELRKAEGFNRIAVAHNADDNVETFFLNALRGSSSRGLKGMERDNGEVIRPLLDCSRKDILNFLSDNGQPYVNDSTNFESDDYRRNFLRNEIFPMLESKWEGFTKAILTTIDLQRKENRIVEHFIYKALQGHQEFLPWEIIKSFPEPETLIYNFIRPFGGSSEIAAEISRSILNISPGKHWTLKESYTATIAKGGLKVENSVLETSCIGEPDYSWRKLGKEEFDFQKIKSAPLSEIFLPASKEHYEWRKAGREMKIHPLGMQGSQPVWKVLKDAGKTQTERERFMVLVEKTTGEPVWLPGIKRSRRHLMGQDADCVWHVTPTCRPKNHGRPEEGQQPESQS